MSARSLLFAIACAGAPAIAAAADPELPGPYAVEVWADPPSPPVPLAMGVFHPTDAPCAGAPLVLVHGAGESGAYKLVMAELLASQGFVVIAPSFANLLFSPAQPEADQINALLAWMIEQADDPGSPIAGKIDPSMQGLAGHSNGGVVFLAASDNPAVAAVVGWDAVAQLPAAAGLSGASLHLRADTIQCGGGTSTAYDAAPMPKAMATVVGSSHCDYDDPESPLCVGVCGAPPWSDAAAKMIERYSVAFFTCVLGHDPSMGAWLDFDMAQRGLAETAHEGSFVCRPACGEGGGSSEDGGSGTSGADTTGADETGGTSGGAGTSGSASTTTGASTTGAEGSSEATGSSEESGAAEPSPGGCGCRSDASGSRAAGLGLAVAVLVRTRKRRAQ